MVIAAALCLIVAHPGPVLSNDHIREGPANMDANAEKQIQNSSDDSA